MGLKNPLKEASLDNIRLFLSFTCACIRKSFMITLIKSGKVSRGAPRWLGHLFRAHSCSGRVVVRVPQPPRSAPGGARDIVGALFYHWSRWHTNLPRDAPGRWGDPCVTCPSDEKFPKKCPKCPRGWHPQNSFWHRFHDQVTVIMRVTVCLCVDTYSWTLLMYTCGCFYSIHNQEPGRPSPVYLYGTNFDVDYHNHVALHDGDGEITLYRATDTGIVCIQYLSVITCIIWSCSGSTSNISSLGNIFKIICINVLDRVDFIH